MGSKSLIYACRGWKVGLKQQHIRWKNLLGMNQILLKHFFVPNYGICLMKQDTSLAAALGAIVFLLVGFDKAYFERIPFYGFLCIADDKPNPTAQLCFHA